MAENDLNFPLIPTTNEFSMPPGSAIISFREVNFADPAYNDPQDKINQVFEEPSLGSIFTASGLSRPNNTSLSNADQSQDYDFGLFNSYIHYMPNPAGGIGLIDKNPYAIKASIIYTRSSQFQSYTPYV